jgi:hypothetical protein
MFWWFAGTGALVVALAAAATSYFANRHAPERSIREVMDRTISWLAIGTFALTLVGCTYFLRTGCPPADTVCDAPAMASMGVLALGGLLVVEIIVVGIPVSFATLKILRRK